MSNALTVRTFGAVFLALFGIGVMFVRTDQGQILVGSLIAAVGITFLMRLGIAFRKR